MQYGAILFGRYYQQLRLWDEEGSRAVGMKTGQNCWCRSSPDKCSFTGIVNPVYGSTFRYQCSNQRHTSQRRCPVNCGTTHIV
ncbi:hypothetical protein BDD12DRAFT_120759 [Trichophaea hybrida]|nr:hypothetical protein BDD12DRAFT_120759 [Trichophaea hybrida]